MSRGIKVYTVDKPQSELAKELGITRQALNMHLHRLREEELVRTGRGFIELTTKALEFLGVERANSFIFVKIEPRLREQVYEKILKMPIEQVYRVTGEVDLVLVLEQNLLASVLRELSKMEGVIHTSSHIVIETIKE
ncbi:MAG: AsnC family transcriptional regulator [Thermoprotei archaeon]|nr:MAG: AsnC family transcriptional regulator [Thermoprotei archaeon]RLF17732.1 MAG: AsnC family transcriptional regulator [Thermoprotei archaeon]